MKCTLTDNNQPFGLGLEIPVLPTLGVGIGRLDRVVNTCGASVALAFDDVDFESMDLGDLFPHFDPVGPSDDENSDICTNDNDYDEIQSLKRQRIDLTSFVARAQALDQNCFVSPLVSSCRAQPTAAAPVKIAVSQTKVGLSRREQAARRNGIGYIQGLATYRRKRARRQLRCNTMKHHTRYTSRASAAHSRKRVKGRFVRQTNFVVPPS